MRFVPRARARRSGAAVGAAFLGACQPTFQLTESLPGARLRPSALQVETALETARVSRARGDSVVITVVARNPRWWPVRVDLGSPGFRMAADARETRGIAFAYRLAAADRGRGGPGGGTWGQPVVWFGPRMAWRHRFVVRLDGPADRPPSQAPDSTGEVMPGRYHVVGAFGTSVAAAVPLEVTP